MKKLLTLFTLLLTVCSGAWGDDFSAKEIVKTGGEEHANITCSSSYTSTTNKKFKNVNGIAAIVVSDNADNAPGNSYIEIKADEGYTLNSPITLQAASNNSSASTFATLFWEGDYNATSADDCKTFEAPANSSTTTDEVTISFTGSYRTIRIYKRICYDNGTIGADAGSNRIGGGQVNVAKITATATATAPTGPTGSHTLTWNVKTGTSQETLETQKKTSTSTYLTSLSDISVNNLEVTEQGKDNSSPKIETPASEVAAKYTYVTFQVADGCTFKINEIDTKLVAVTDAKTVKLEISDNNGGTTQSLSYSHSKDSDPGTVHKFNFNENNYYSGTVTIKLYVYGATSTYRMGKPLTIKGDVTLTHVPVTITDLSAIEGSTYTGKNYATLYYSDVALAVPSGVKAYTYKMDGEALVVSRTYENGGTYPVIPAGEAVVVESDAGASYNFNVSTTETTVDTNSLLEGTDASTTIDESGYKYYKLAMNDALTSVGFYFAVDGGTSITNGAHKAYLRVSTTASKEYFVLGGEGVEEPQNETDGINAVDIAIANGATIYNLAGQKVGANYKGIVVINGKKVVRK